MNDRIPHIKDLEPCLQCGYCSNVCPVREDIRWESAAPRGKVFWLKNLQKDSLWRRMLGISSEPTEEMIRRFAQCTSCGRCTTMCQTGIEFHEWIEEIREWMVRRAFGPLAAHKTMATSLWTKHNPLDAPHDKRMEWCEEKDFPKKSDTVLFLGCVQSYNQFKLATSALKLMKASGSDFTLLGEDEWCCGNILGLTGQTERLKAVAEHNISEVEKRGATRLVTNCPGCLRTLEKMYPKHGVKPGFEVVHLSEYLNEAVEDGKLKFTKPFKGSAAYHDPCDLGRICGVFEPPRALLSSIPGMNFLEFNENKMNATCCGGGGGLKAIESDMSVRIGGKRVESAAETGANTIVSGCPNCKFNLNQAIVARKAEEREKGAVFKMEMMDLTEIAVRCL